MQDAKTTRPGAAPATTDEESGDGGKTTTDQDLHALKVMLDRGLMSQADFDQRRAEIVTAASRPRG